MLSKKIEDDPETERLMSLSHEEFMVEMREISRRQRVARLQSFVEFLKRKGLIGAKQIPIGTISTYIDDVWDREDRDVVVEVASGG